VCVCVCISKDHNCFLADGHLRLQKWFRLHTVPEFIHFRHSRMNGEKRVFTSSCLSVCI